MAVDEKRNETLLDLFTQPGWKMLMSELEEARYTLASTTHLLDTEAELHRRKGEILQMDKLLSLESLVRHQLMEAAEEMFE